MPRQLPTPAAGLCHLLAQRSLSGRLSNSDFIGCRIRYARRWRALFPGRLRFAEISTHDLWASTSSSNFRSPSGVQLSATPVISLPRAPITIRRRRALERVFRCPSQSNTHGMLAKYASFRLGPTIEGPCCVPDEGGTRQQPLATGLLPNSASPGATARDDCYPTRQKRLTNNNCR
jgi:hypothetical protein